MKLKHALTDSITVHTCMLAHTHAHTHTHTHAHTHRHTRRHTYGDMLHLQHKTAVIHVNTY